MNSISNRIDRLKLRADIFSGTLFRSAAPKYAITSDLMTGEGSRRAGGRWNPVGIAAFYGSMSPEAAMAETLAYIRYYGLPAQAAMPRTFVAVNVQLSKVLDLTDGRIRQSLGLSLARMREADWRSDMRRGRASITQVVGQAAFDAGLEGLLVPSAAESDGTNLVCFVDNVFSSSHIDIISADEL